jgi:hypothetical protein
MIILPQFVFPVCSEDCKQNDPCSTEYRHCSSGRSSIEERVGETCGSFCCLSVTCAGLGVFPLVFFLPR